MSAYEVDAATMCDALSHVPGVEHVVLEFDEQGDGLLRVQVAGGLDHKAVVGAAVHQMRHRFGLGVEHKKLRLTGPTGRPVVAVVETLRDEPARPPHPDDLDGLGGPGPVDEALVDAVDGAFGGLQAPDDLQDLDRLQDVDGLGPLDGAAEHDELPPESFGRHRVDPVQLPPERRPENFYRPRQSAAAEAGARVVVERVVVTSELGEVVATVQLRAGEDVHEGTAARPSGGSSAHRALAAATASAIERVVPSRARLEVDEVDLLQVGLDHVAVVVLSLLGPNGIDRLAGSALVRGDAQDAVVRATLDALNRRAGLTS